MWSLVRWRARCHAGASSPGRVLDPPGGLFDLVAVASPESLEDGDDLAADGAELGQLVVDACEHALELCAAIDVARFSAVDAPQDLRRLVESEPERLRLLHEQDALDRRGVEEAVARRCARRRQQDPEPLVEAHGIDSHPGQSRHLADLEALLHAPDWTLTLESGQEFTVEPCSTTLSSSAAGSRSRTGSPRRP